MIDLTPEQQIAKDYAACMDSVNLLQAGQPEGMTEADWLDTVARNVAHLEIMLAKDIFAGFDVTPLQQAAGVTE